MVATRTQLEGGLYRFVQKIIFFSVQRSPHPRHPWRAASRSSGVWLCSKTPEILEPFRLKDDEREKSGRVRNGLKEKSSRRDEERSGRRKSREESPQFLEVKNCAG